MRGKEIKHLAMNAKSRITPAYAGKRERFDLFSAGIWDHPRLCGEKLQKPKQPLGTTGSPPPMRGKDHSAFVPA